jgi:hypothetical protein
MGLYETQNYQGQNETLVLFFAIKQNSYFILPRFSYSLVLPYLCKLKWKIFLLFFRVQ